MEHIPVRYAARVGMRCPARVDAVWEYYLELTLDLTRIAPGRSPTIRAGLRFDRTVAPEHAWNLVCGDPVEVVLIDVAEADGYDWVQASLPAALEWLTWNNETVRHLARHIRETGELALLPVLADALEDAGCADAALLDHCREPHEPGAHSWAVELLATQT